MVEGACACAAVELWGSGSEVWPSRRCMRMSMPLEELPLWRMVGLGVGGAGAAAESGAGEAAQAGEAV